MSAMSEEEAWKATNAKLEWESEWALRDQFAMALLSGALADPSYDPDPGDAVAYAYGMADAMLAERAKRRKESPP